MLTKREKILLQVLGMLILLALVISFLYTPALVSRVEMKAERESMQEELQGVRQIYQSTGLGQRLKEEKELADNNYKYFYSVLNSYTIDDIVNSLLQQENLQVYHLEIAPYENANYDFAPLSDDIETGEASNTQNAQENVLVKSTITVQIAGTYENILNFIDRLNETSTCIRVSSMSIKESSGFMEAMLKIYVYGISLQPTVTEANIASESGLQTTD